jgi:hypothetical protein
MSRVARRFTSLLATTAVLSLLIAGCGSSNPSAPTTPSPSIPIVSGGPPIATGAYTVSGVVAESGRPVANASVNAWVETSGAGYSYWYAHGPLHTDASGGYRMTSLPGGARVWVQLNKDGYVQQCAASVILSGDLTLDLALVLRANLTASPMPEGPGLRSISGTVVERTAKGSQPVSGASVIVAAETIKTFAPSENPAAYTYSDANGRFALCGLPANNTLHLEAGVGGTRSTQVSVAPSQTSDVEIMLP